MFLVFSAHFYLLMQKGDRNGKGFVGGVLDWPEDQDISLDYNFLSYKFESTLSRKYHIITFLCFSDRI